MDGDYYGNGRKKLIVVCLILLFIGTLYFSNGKIEFSGYFQDGVYDGKGLIKNELN